MKRTIPVMLALVILLVLACTKDHEDLPTSFIYDPPPTPTDLEVTSGPERAELQWSYPDASLSLVSEFYVYLYVPAYGMEQLIGTTSDKFYVDSLLIGNLEYCYKVSAVDTTGFEGWRTDAVCVFVRSALR